MLSSGKMILFFLAALCCLTLPAGVWAVNLDQAKAQGQVGEKLDGYLGAVVASPEINALVQEVNQKRREKYQDISNRNHTPLSSVEALAGNKAVEMTESGRFVQNQNGQWVKK